MSGEQCALFNYCLIDTHTYKVIEYLDLPRTTERSILPPTERLIFRHISRSVQKARLILRSTTNSIHLHKSTYSTMIYLYRPTTRALSRTTAYSISQMLFTFIQLHSFLVLSELDKTFLFFNQKVFIIFQLN